MSRSDSQMSAPAIEQMAGKGAARAARRAAIRRGEMHSSRGASYGVNRRPGWLTYAFLTITVLLSAAPIYYAVLLASSTGPAIAQNPLPLLFPDLPKLWENLSKLLTQPNVPVMRAAWNSLLIATITALAVMFFSTLAGFAFAKLRFKGSNALLLFIIGTMAVPAQLSIVPLFIVMKQLQWVGTIQAVIVPGLASAFGVFWMTQYLRSALPYELVEAARVDGCSMFRTFWHVGLPAARPAMSMLGLFSFVGSWTSFFWPYIILGPQNPTLPLALALLQGRYFKDYSLIMSGVVITTVPLIILFIFAGRQLVAGVMQGAVKG
ncbi:MAG: carbohydrate ABC transporter permease [Actinomycetaceae bacterium]|nr:carbohydrate ABC transporter permease [Actinomycetaceae bacterium]